MRRQWGLISKARFYALLRQIETGIMDDSTVRAAQLAWDSFGQEGQQALASDPSASPADQRRLRLWAAAYQAGRESG